jgi:hypothetical protein
MPCLGVIFLNQRKEDFMKKRQLFVCMAVLFAFVIAIPAFSQSQAWSNIDAPMSTDHVNGLGSFVGIKFTKTTGAPDSKTGFIGTITKSDGKTQVGVNPGANGQNITALLTLKSSESTADIVLKTASNQYVEFETWRVGTSSTPASGSLTTERSLWQIQPSQEVVFRIIRGNEGKHSYQVFFRPNGSSTTQGRLKTDRDFYDFYQAMAMIEYLSSINTAEIKKEVDKIRNEVKAKPEFKGKPALDINHETYRIFRNRKNLLVGTIAGLKSTLPDFLPGEYYANLKINLARAQTAWAVAYIYATAPSQTQFRNDLWILLSDLPLETACNAFLEAAQQAGVSAVQNKITSTAQESAKKQIMKQINSSNFGKSFMNSGFSLAKSARNFLKKGARPVSAAFAIRDGLDAATDHLEFSDRARGYYW